MMRQTHGDFKLGKSLDDRTAIGSQLADRMTHTLILGPTGSGKTARVLLPMMAEDLYATNVHVKDGLNHARLGQVIFDPEGSTAKSFWAMGQVAEQELRQRVELALKNIQASLTKQQQQLETDIAKTDTLSQEMDRTALLNKEQLTSQLMRVSFLAIDFKAAKKTDFSLWRTNKLEQLVSIFEKLMSSPQTSSATGRIQIQQLTDSFQDYQEPVHLFGFDNTDKHPLRFNPLAGSADEASEIIYEALDLAKGQPPYFAAMIKQVIFAIVSLVKGALGSQATFSDFFSVLTDYDKGHELLSRWQMETDSNEDSIASTIDFLNDYYRGLEGGRHKSTIADNTAELRGVVALFYREPDIQKNLVLSPDQFDDQTLDFDKVLLQAQRLAISTCGMRVSATNKRIMERLLFGQLAHAIVKRPQPSESRNPVILYLVSGRDYLIPDDLEMVINEGRSYNVGTVLESRALDSLGQYDRSMTENIKSNVRSVVLFPGLTETDADYFSTAFGEEHGQPLVPKSDLLYDSPSYRHHQKKPYVYARLVNHNDLLKPSTVAVTELPKPFRDKLDMVISQRFQN